MRVNAYRTLRISLAALVMLFVFADIGFAMQTYVVRRGDTLHAISGKYGTTVSAIQKANGLKSSLILTGQILRIPSSEASKASDPVTYGRSQKDDLQVVSDGKTIAKLSKGSGFIVLGRESGKFKVKLADGRTGWVDAKVVTLEEGPSTLLPADSFSRRQDIARTALSFRGARYRRGGESPGAFDCSGLVKYVFATKGVKLPHDSRAQFKCGKPVQKSDLQEGDVVFFANTYRRGISHVGIYIGNGKFVHASTRRTGVRVDQLDADYYRRHYAGARRIE